MAPAIILDSDDARPVSGDGADEMLTVERWPQRLTGSSVWRPATFRSAASYTYDLNRHEVEELEAALRIFKGQGLDGPDMSPVSFPLPSLRPKLRAMARSLHSGRGFLVLSGLDSARYSIEDNVLLFLGISSYIGDRRAKQDDEGNMLVHLCHDRDICPNQEEGPTRHSNKASPFHNDMFTDLIALQVRGMAASGGAFKVASAACVYNEIRAKRPDLIDILAGPNWGFESRGKLFPSCRRPILFYHDGRVMFDFSPKPLHAKAKGVAQTPTSELTGQQLEALDMLESVAKELEVIIPMGTGDLVFLNNHALFHSRESFRDSGLDQRHLVRLWLKNQSLAWRLPPSLDAGNRKIFGENSLPENWALHKMPKLPVPWYKFTGSSH